MGRVEPIRTAIPKGPLDLAAYEAFREAWPGDQRFELVDGVPVMRPPSTWVHQVICGDILFLLESRARATDAPWEAMPTLGLTLSGLPRDIPEPDVLVRPRTPLEGWICPDPIVLVEVLSPSTQERDLGWKRLNYPRIETLMHYLVVAQDEAAMVLHDRATGFQPVPFTAADGPVPLDAIGVALPFPEVYRDTGLLPPIRAGG